MGKEIQYTCVSEPRFWIVVDMKKAIEEKFKYENLVEKRRSTGTLYEL